MNVRRGNVGRLESELRSLRERIEKTEKERAQSAELAKNAAAERRAAADDPQAFEAAEKKAARHRSEVERLGLLLERLELDVAECERRIAEARFGDAYVRLEAAAERQRAAGKVLATHLTAAVKAFGVLTAARDEHDAALSDARERCPDGVEFELPETSDEPSYPDGAKRLAEAIKAGPRQPLARTRTAIEKQQRDFEIAEQARLREAVEEVLLRGDFSRIDQLRPERLPEALKLLERRVDSYLKERAKRNAEASHLVEGGRQTKELARQLERRVERLRERVAEAEQVETAA